MSDKQFEGHTPAEEFEAMEDVIDRYDIDMYSLMTFMAFQDPTELSVVKQAIDEMGCDRDTVRWAIYWWNSNWGGVPEETLNYLELNNDDYNAEEFEADNCEGKKLKDSGYCNLNFDWSSSGLSRSCQTCGNEEFMDEYWDSQRISMSEPEEGKILCSMTEWNGGRDENDLGYCSFDFNYGSDGAFSECEFCGTEVMATFDNSFYDDDDDDDDEFESEFSKRDMLNLKKYIDYPMRWIDKNIRPSSDAKVRKIEQKSKGQIPTKKTTDSFRQKIETPNWFKAVQVGILASVVGVMYFKDSGAIEEPEEPEEQKEE